LTQLSKKGSEKPPNVTLLLKTLLRPKGLYLTLKSINSFYRNIPILIADDSPSPYPEVIEDFNSSGNIKYYIFPEDEGIGICLNRLLKEVQTEFFVLLEDDFIFNEKTNIHTMEREAIDTQGSILGGIVSSTTGKETNFIGKFDFSRYPIAPSLNMVSSTQEIEGITEWDVIPNFFIAKTQDVIDFEGFSKQLKVARHIHFFLKARGWREKQGKYPVAKTHSVFFSTSTNITHRNRGELLEDPAIEEERIKLRRKRLPEFRKVYLDLWGFKAPPKGEQLTT
jgi:glycosyltransferase involved in cell wall biosynthesis